MVSGQLGIQVIPVQGPVLTGEKINTQAMEWAQYLQRQRTLYQMADQGKLKLVDELLLKTHSLRRPMLVINAGRTSMEAVSKQTEQDDDSSPQISPVDAKVLKLDLPSLVLLHRLGVLKATTETFEVRVERNHIRMLTSQRAVRHAEDLQVLAFEEEVRVLLEEGQMHFLSDTHNDPTPAEEGTILQGVNALLQDATPNSRVVLSDRTAQHEARDHFGQPVLDVLHVLEGLVNKKISVEERYGRLQDLRRSRFMFVPLSAQELQFHLKNTQVQQGAIHETEDLKVLRGYYAEVLQGQSPFVPITLKEDQSSDPGDITFAQLFQQSIRKTLFWVYNTMEDPLMAEAHANWVYRMLHMPMSVMLQQPWARHPTGRNKLNLETLEAELIFTASSQIRSPGRRRNFVRWYNDEVMVPRLAYKPELADSLAQSHIRYLQQALRDKKTRIEVQAIRMHFAELHELFPEPVKRLLLRDPTYLNLLGSVVHPTVTLGHAKFDSSVLLPELVKAADGQMAQVKSLEQAEQKPHKYTITAMFSQDQVGKPEQQYIFVLHPVSKKLSRLRLELSQYLLVQPDVSWQKHFLENHPTLREISASERSKIIEELCQETSPFKRIERFERTVKSSGVLHYGRLQDTIEDPNLKSFGEVQWMPEQASSILRAASLLGLLEGQSWEAAQEHIWRALKDQPEWDHLQLAAFSEVPTPLPEDLVQQAEQLEEQEYNALLKTLLSLPYSPTGMGQLLQFLQPTRGKTRYSQRIRNLLVKRMTQPDMLTEVKAYCKVLAWVYRELSTPTFRWPATAVLAASWIHAGLTYGIMRQRTSAESILDNFQAPHQGLPMDMLAVRPEVAGDRLFPEQDAELLYLHLLRQGLTLQEGQELGKKAWMQNLLLNPFDQAPPARLHWRLMHKGFARLSHLGTHLIYPPAQLGEFFLADHTPHLSIWGTGVTSEEPLDNPEDNSIQAAGAEEPRVKLDWWVPNARWATDSPIEGWQDFWLNQIKHTDFQDVADENLERALMYMFMCSEVLPFLTDVPEARLLVHAALEKYLQRADQVQLHLPWVWLSRLCLHLAMVGQDPLTNLKSLVRILEDMFMSRPDYHLDVLSLLIRLGDVFGSDAPSMLWDAILRFRVALSNFELLGDDLEERDGAVQDDSDA